MAEYQSYIGRLSSSSAVVFVYCPCCDHEHEYQATDELRAGRKVLVAAKCAESTTTERGEIVPNRSALRGSNIWLSLK